MPKYKPIDYAPFFGDELASTVEMDGTGEDISQLVHVILPDLGGLQRAISAVSRVRAKSQAYLGLTPEQYAARQQILQLARSILIAERNKLIEQLKTALHD